MLGLKLRQEFQGRRLQGTAIELANEKKTGATQVPAPDFLEITYPSSDLLKAIEAIGPDQGRPLVLIGERGQGKSHLMAALYHALSDEPATRNWLNTWTERLNNPRIAQLPLRKGMNVISESLHRQRYKFLWDLLFDRHPHGNYIRGKWEGLGAQKTDVPPDNLILELLGKQPAVLMLDEFQTWFDGLTNSRNQPHKNWAFNFIQILTDIAKEHPDKLVLVVSVRNGNTDAYQQIHRVNPVQVDFKGPNADKERRRLLLHRLFENRLQINANDIQKLTANHISEYLRLADVPPSENERKQQEIIEAWPFAPHLMQLLEDQVLIATDAQETRDLIKILAALYKRSGETSAIITAASFRLDEDDSAIGSLLDSVSNQHHANLREKAQRNLSAVREALTQPEQTVPHLSEIVGALWLRSLAVGNMAGAEPALLQIDITRNSIVDDNAFQVELSTIVENSFNIHQIGSRLVFREEENPQAKLMAHARNDRLFTDGADRRQLAKEIRYVLGGSDDVARDFRVLVLPFDWQASPWSEMDEGEQPDKWDERLPLVVLPESPERLDETLGQWLKSHLQKRRNTVRFLLPRADSESAYRDRDLIILARAVIKAHEWQADGSEYKKLHQKYQSELRAIIKQRFDRFAILRTWNYANPSRCRLHVEQINAQGSQIPEKIDEAVRNDLFIPEDFNDFVFTAAQNNNSVGKVINELQEPRPNEQDCIPWIGETLVKEKVIRLCARGRIAINLRGMEYLQTNAGEDEETAWRRIRGRLGSGRHLEETFLLLPQAVPQAQGYNSQSVSAVVQSTQSEGALFTAEPISPMLVGESQTSAATPPTLCQPASLFVGEPTKRVTPLSASPTSPLNLLGKVEGWGVGPATKVSNLSLRVAGLSGAQLQQLLRVLPDGLIYEFSCEKEEG
jgi:hypothetical protein